MRARTIYLRGLSGVVLVALSLVGFALGATGRPSILGITVGNTVSAGRVITISGRRFGQVTSITGRRFSLTLHHRLADRRSAKATVPTNARSHEITVLTQTTKYSGPGDEGPEESALLHKF